jgi:hypothetical protein
MNEIQIYSTIMFFAGVILSQAIFYFDQKNKKRKFYIYLSAIVLQILDSVHSVHLGTLEFITEQIKNPEEPENQEYLQKESEKVELFMNLYLLVLIRAIPEEGRKHIKYRTWTEARTFIEKMRGLMDGKDKS